MKFLKKKYMSKLSRQTDTNSPKRFIPDYLSRPFIKRTGKKQINNHSKEGTGNGQIPRTDILTLKLPEESIPLPKFSHRHQENHKKALGESGNIPPSARKNSELTQTKMLGRLKNKTRKIKMYWAKSTLVIPNVFKMSIYYQEDDIKEMIEFNDLSLKSILIMNSMNRIAGQMEGDLDENSNEEVSNKGSIEIENDEFSDHLFADLDFQFKSN